MTQHPEGATLHLGGDAWAHPDLEPLLRPITNLHPYPGNPRRGDQDAITASIRDLGLYKPLTAQAGTGHVLAGNHTMRALLELGAERVPATYLAVTDTSAAAIVARDNLTSDLAVNDSQALLDLLADVDVLALSGYADEDLADLRALLAAPDLDALADLHGDPTDEDNLETIKVQVRPATAKLWRAARTAVGGDDPVAVDTELVEAMHRAITAKAKA